MISNFTVGIYNKMPSTKINGITIPGDLAWVRNTDCDMQPYSTELLIKAYGYDIPVTKRFFIEDVSDIKIGTILQYGSEQHEVKKIIPWDNYFDVITLEVT